MHYKIRYHNKPHDLRLSNIRLVPLGKGILLVTCELNLRGYGIDYHGGSLCGNWKKTSRSIYFGDDSLPGTVFSTDDSIASQQEQKMRAELILYPDTPEEANLALQVDGISKITYRGILVSQKCLNRKWAEYENNLRWEKALKGNKSLKVKRGKV
jgi:hypothetical protein